VGIEDVGRQRREPTRQIGAAGGGRDVAQVDGRAVEQQHAPQALPDRRRRAVARQRERLRECGREQRFQRSACCGGRARREQRDARRIARRCLLQHASGERQPLERAGIGAQVAEHRECLTPVAERRGAHAARLGGSACVELPPAGAFRQRGEHCARQRVRHQGKQRIAVGGAGGAPGDHGGRERGRQHGATAAYDPGPHLLYLPPLAIITHSIATAAQHTRAHPRAARATARSAQRANPHDRTSETGRSGSG
jgi:hypothetical protein